jgi:hypothetical protein
VNKKRIDEIREWITAEKELYARFCEEENSEALGLVRARVFFCAMRDIPDLLRYVDEHMVPPKHRKAKSCRSK